MNDLYIEVELELKNHILPFWMNLIDRKNGGFYGEVDFNLRIKKEADKGGIYISRLLWTFSAAYRVTKDREYLEHAQHLYCFLRDKVLDNESLGLYWLVDYKGNAKDTRKHIYAQSFGVYALSEYYRATKEKSALNLAISIYELIETKGFSNHSNAYMEEFDRNWNPVPNEMLSENGVMADITMNTHIHILEAYTNLFKAWPNEQLKSRIENLLDIHFNKIYDKESKFLDVFFDRDWNSILDIKSFGHDIEASWLIDEALKTLKVENDDYHQMVIDIAYNIANYAIHTDGALPNEEVNGVIDQTRVWWVQAEAIVGFYNAFERTEDDMFLTIIRNIWLYIKKNIIDQRPKGEWYWSVDEAGVPSKENIGDPWKASYHNGRFCLEIMERMLNK